MQSVLYAVDINEQCPALFDYIKSPQDNFWTMTRKGSRLRIGDRLAVSILVQNGNEIYNRNEVLEIVEKNYFLAVSPDIGSNLINSFDQCELKRFCKESKTFFGGSTVCQGTLIFEDDFDQSPILNTKYWSYDISLRVNGDSDEEFVMFGKDEATTFIKDGHLHIKPIPREAPIQKNSINLGEKCTSVGEECAIKADKNRRFLPPVKSAQISTKNFTKFKYGRVEIRAKLPKGDWLFPRLMLRSVDDSQPHIIIAFALGNTKLLTNTIPPDQIGGEVLRGGIITWRSDHDDVFDRDVKDPKLDLKKHESTIHYGNDFHTYSLLWNKTSLTFGVDNNDYATIHQSMSQECYIILGVSIGGHIFFPDGAVNFERTVGKPWKNMSHKAVLHFWKSMKKWRPTWENSNALQVDYVRVYAL